MPRKNYTFSVLAVLLLACPPIAQASTCDATATLARIHDRYRLILTETGPHSTVAATQIMALVADTDTKHLAQALGDSPTDMEIERLDHILQVADKVARDLIIGVATPNSGPSLHNDNLAWLAHFVGKSDCQGIFTPTTAQPKTRSIRPGISGIRQLGDWTFTLRTPDLSLFALVLGLISCLAALVRKSRPYRIKQAERLPRHSTTQDLNLSFRSPKDGSLSARVTALDVSVGGMKLAWQGAPPKGTNLLICLPWGEAAASIVWSNAHYAGVMFDRRLAPENLRQLLA